MGVCVLAIFLDNFSAFFDRDLQPQTKELSSDRILYCYDFIFYVLQLEWAKCYREILCQRNYQMSLVTSFV